MEAEGAGSAHSAAQGRNCKSREEARTDCRGDVGASGEGAGIGAVRGSEKVVSEEIGERQGAGCERDWQGEGESAGSATLTRRAGGAPHSPRGRGRGALGARDIAGGDG